MYDTRADIVKKAIMDKLGHDIEVYRSADILAVANIDDDQMKELAAHIENEASNMAFKTPKFTPSAPSSSKKEKLQTNK